MEITNIPVSIGGELMVAESMVAMNSDQLARLNAILAETPTMNRYDNNKIEEKKRIKLEATLTIRARSFDVV